MVLAGIRVLDVGSYVAGPAAATMMGDFGAEVIKIEPPEGDPYGTCTGYQGAPWAIRDYYWVLDSRNKKSLVLDLKRRGGQGRARAAGALGGRLPDEHAARRPGEDWHPLGRSRAAQRASGLRVAHRLWRERARGGHDRLRRHRMVGAPASWTMLAGAGRPAGALDSGDGRPRYRDGLVRRRHDGALPARAHRQGGRWFSQSLMAAGLWSNAMYVQAHLCGAVVRQRPPREEALDALGNMYRCGDDRWFMLAALSEERQWPGLVRAFGRPDLAEDPRFADLEARRKHVHGLVADARRDLRDAPVGRWRERLDAEGITFGGIAKLEDLAGDRQMLESGALTPLADPRRRGRAHREQSGVLRGRREGQAGTRTPPRRAHGRSLADMWIRRGRDRDAAARGRRGGGGEVAGLGHRELCLGGPRLSMAAKRAATWSGFERYASIPASRHCSLSPTIALAVIATIGMCLPLALAFVLPDGDGGLEAVHLRHLHVHEDEVEGLGLQRF